MSQPMFALLDLLLVFVAVAAFAWWQLRDVAQAQREAARKRQTDEDRAADHPKS